MITFLLFLLACTQPPETELPEFADHGDENPPVASPLNTEMNYTNVHTKGDALSVSITDRDGHTPTAKALPPGKYDIIANFGEGSAPAGQFTIKENQNITLKCIAMMRRCSPT